MRSRWFHVPVLHRPHHGAEKRPTWLELFYDLVFVAAFIQIGNGLAADVSPGGIAGFALVFVPMWVSWTGVTFFTNHFTVDDLLHRLLVFVQMFAIGGMAIAAPDALAGRPTAFAIANAVAQLVVALLYLRTARQVPEGRVYSAYWARIFGGGALLWAISVALPAPYHQVPWALGLVLVLAAPATRGARVAGAAAPIDREHLAERYGLLTLIVIGESFVKVVTGLHGGADLGPLVQASFTLLLTCCVWWIYFDDVAGSELKDERLSPLLWLYGHLPLQLGVTATGVAIKKAVAFDLAAPAPEAYRWLLCLALGVTFLATAVIDSVTERKDGQLSDRLRVNARISAGVLLILLAPAGGGMSAATFLALLTALCVGQVVFDLMMAPLQAVAANHEARSVSDVFRERTAAGASTRMLRPRFGEAVRLGTPSDLRSDIYFYFMQGGWFRFFAAIGFLYLMINVFFGALYYLRPGCIGGADPRSFLDAFAFSVQTLSTVGYGVLHPATDYAHAIVAVELGVGLLAVAMMTGLAFAKVSRPHASVLFSRPILVTTMDGTPTLQFRVGNARGNDVVDATVTVTALIDTLTAEGQHLRRMTDLKLVRDRTPLFTLAWVVMHKLDASSPLHGVTADGFAERVVSIVVTLLGHDGTYNQTVYTRTQYYPEDVRWNHRFVDVTSQLPDGRMQVDYRRFHDTVPDAPAATADAASA